MGIKRTPDRRFQSRYLLDDYISEPAGWVDQREEPDVETDIDVCQVCGGYYGGSPALTNKWRASYNPGPRDVMPQRCMRCM